MFLHFVVEKLKVEKQLFNLVVFSIKCFFQMNVLFQNLPDGLVVDCVFAVELGGVVLVGGV